MAPSKMSLSVKALSQMALSITILNIMSQGIGILGKKALSIKPLIITTVSHLTLGARMLRIE
jgi:hypothetical protein